MWDESYGSANLREKDLAERRRQSLQVAKGMLALLSCTPQHAWIFFKLKRFGGIASPKLRHYPYLPRELRLEPRAKS